MPPLMKLNNYAQHCRKTNLEISILHIDSKNKNETATPWTECCDGMLVTFQVICGTDTSKLYFRSRYINLDSSDYKITKGTIGF